MAINYTTYPSVYGLETTEPLTSSGTLAAEVDNVVVDAVLSSSGVATSPTGGTAAYTSSTFLVHDLPAEASPWASLEAYGVYANSYVPMVGDTLNLQGIYSPYHQTTELASVATVQFTTDYPNPSPAGPLTTVPWNPTVSLSISALAMQNVVNPSGGTNSYVGLPATLAATMITLDDVTISGSNASLYASGGTNTGLEAGPGASVAGLYFGNTKSSASNWQGTITDQYGSSVELYYWPSSYSSCFSAFGGTAIPTGLVDATGFLQVYGSGGTAQVEFIPTGITPVPEPGTLALVAICGVCAFAVGIARLRKLLRS